MNYNNSPITRLYIILKKVNLFQKYKERINFFYLLCYYIKHFEKSGDTKMRNRKTRKEKIRRDQKRAEYKKQLNELRELKEILERKVANKRKEAIKGFHIRNLQVFRDTCNFLAPFVLCAGISVGGLYFLEGGLPIKNDEITRFKKTDFTIEEQGEYPSLKEEYVYSGIFSSEIPESIIIINTPWEAKDDYYVKHIREYNITANQEEIIKSILQKDYQGLYEQLSNYKEIEEITNHPLSLEDKYTISGSIHFINKEDKITFPESTKKNIVITIIEAILTLTVGGTIAYRRNFSYLESLNDDQYDYQFALNAYHEAQDELIETNEKILTLKRGGRNL